MDSRNTRFVPIPVRVGTGSEGNRKQESRRPYRRSGGSSDGVSGNSASSDSQAYRYFIRAYSAACGSIAAVFGLVELLTRK